MIKIENFETVGWEAAIRGMRNPMNSWDKSDSYYTYIEDAETQQIAKFQFFAGDADHELMMKLTNNGPVHGKYRRMIVVYADITAPLYWWKEFDTYKVGTVANSCSTMHKIHEKEFTLDDFSHEHLIDEFELDLMWGDIIPRTTLECTVYALNMYRNKYIETKNKPMKDEAARKALMKKYWWQMIQLLPSSYNQKRTVMLNYEVLANIYKYRKNHKLDEWVELCKWIESLPYAELITGEEKVGND